MAHQPTDPTSIAEIGRRLELTRQALGLTQVMMGRLMGAVSNGQAWGNYESGKRRISVDHALALSQNLGLPLDWIYQGRMVNLPPELREKIQHFMLEARPQTLTRRLRPAGKEPQPGGPSRRISTRRGGASRK
jgi:transcriptional regulator with XRE-family HTH domain